MSKACPKALGGQELLAALCFTYPPSAFPQFPCILGNMSRTMWMAAGPTRITKMPGKMNSTRGKMSLTAVLAAFSSANWRRRVRIDSLCTRRAWAMLEPNLSAWMSTAARRGGPKRRCASPIRGGPRPGRAHLQLEIGQGKFLRQHPVGPFHLVADLAHGLIEPQAGLHAHHHEVQGVGQGEKDRLAAALSHKADDGVGQVEEDHHQHRSGEHGDCG